MGYELQPVCQCHLTARRCFNPRMECELQPVTKVDKDYPNKFQSPYGVRVATRGKNYF